ncbi:ABC transporter-related protein [Leptolyngbya boryana NIES-2135]|jgi:ATP-binding cassette subfamily B multidrug efflux pump|uniref:ABC transporter-related protein n=1 Tax=Leptolyngbya boryana NIES-2135 TaxID=1973484 RepID=A0A1Z4JIJ1_LEPBY|nr:MULTISPECIES: ABC transporter ATP-binding protein [Leptolyngbya]BAY56559.1 ABC transporter-related protein [Leptolyngbya boryana NIES-2135]MBD2369864.1 ABC transporter ATP-binding protein [Leptolyngbya sp. FACHB-161]MBD2376191.1 ABC transporter ATP-binding protein [Leptolyngbya sp. FACHB-238]MBD2400466.1 ABC transporter ATP-binding protein [Leptolyngbya sp. FACHB-239]MBD2407008.1 ABC transporter ATP-binding protein [Leptolyngbya sp. FACHB-402]
MNSSRSKETDWRLFLRLAPYARRNLKLLLLSMVFLVPSAIASTVQPILIGKAVSLLKREPSAFDMPFGFLRDLSLSQGLNALALLLLTTIVFRLIFDASQGFLVQNVGQRITANIRNDLFDHVTSLAVRFFDRTPVGKLITRLTSDVEALGEVFSTGAIGVVGDLFTMLTITVTMFLIQWQLALLLIFMLIPVTGLIVYFQQQYRKSNYRAREELSDLNSMLQENITGIGVVQLFRREQFNSQLFREVNQRYIKEVDRTIFFDSAVSATLEWISLVAIAGVLGVGGWLVTGGNLNFGVLSTFILFAQRLFDPLRQFAEKFTAIQAGFTAVERVSEILNEPIEIRDPANGQIPPSSQAGEIRFENVSFAYKADEFVLHNLDFTIRPGEQVALVGPTGAGKSSIIRLLSRLYEPTSGRILLDGVDIRDLPQAELRRRMAIILQDGFIFAGDVKSNITLGESYSFEQIRSAAERTNVDRLIEQLPQGYNTALRERGTNLSGGQKQLLAFARAAIRDPKILVLDEATASLDVGTEALIQEALEHLLENRTAIIIAHRLSTIRNVDRILVLKRGQLIESGTHEELLNLGGLYASLYHLQMLES